jgi:voltage-gated potassium channel
MNANRRIFVAIILLLSIISFGTTGYVLIEKEYSWFDGLYMTMITIATVGFGEVKPLSQMGRIFTILLIVIGFSSLTFIAHSLFESILETISNKSSEIKKMHKKIEQLSRHYIICGFGRVGEAAAEHFKKAGADYVIVESSPEQCEELKERKEYFVEGDATHEETLLKAGIKRASGLLAMLDTDPDNLFIVLSARELNPTLRIFSRSATPSAARKIIQAGADHVISPYKSAGRQVADDILRATGHSSLFADAPETLSLPPVWLEITPGSSLAGKTIKKVAADQNAMILGLRRRDHDILMPDPQITIVVGDTILLQNSSTQGEQGSASANAPPRKIVIIDDNPVILRLYNRLFQKAGFHPLCAEKSKDGLELILKEEPTAAVIDYHMPGMSGVEICREIRKIRALDHVKLIIFTADDMPATRAESLSAGADEVVVKSANASEIIELVIHHLNKER